MKTLSKIGLMTMMSLTFCFVVISCSKDDDGGGSEDKAPSSVIAVDLGLSVKWANCNLGATTPEEYGGYYAWGETTPKTDYSSNTFIWDGFSNSSLQSQGVIDSNGNLKAAYDAAAKNWGGKWRMPTSSEITELKTKCTWTWTALNGISGYKVVGSNGNSIFLPAVGYRYNTSVYEAGTYGNFWSSTYNCEDEAYRLLFSSSTNSFGSSSGYCCCGSGIRPVAK